ITAKPTKQGEHVHSFRRLAELILASLGLALVWLSLLVLDWEGETFRTVASIVLYNRNDWGSSFFIVGYLSFGWVLGLLTVLVSLAFVARIASRHNIPHLRSAIITTLALLAVWHFVTYTDVYSRDGLGPVAAFLGGVGYVLALAAVALGKWISRGSSHGVGPAG
ncbi:MAG: hypothetical protein LC808_26335, partial [Actinobacteria bacterium]|nr:hypothetical protein [Actinomycetota bacterium]